jgi:HAD superfamily hydrolase (TIGR01662 family)
MSRHATDAVFFDVDFTLIHPGPTFQAEGYQRFCASHRIQIDASGFERAVESASALLDQAQDSIYDPQIFIDYTARIIHGMGGSGDTVAACARQIYEEWAACQHFSLYEEVPEVIRSLHAKGLRIGLISNTHRCLASFQSHFELEGLFAAAVSSSLHGYMKPHPSIFEAALSLAGVPASRSVMVGDSVKQDIEGARAAGMRGILVCRSGQLAVPAGPDIPVIRSLTELADLL